MSESNDKDYIKKRYAKALEKADEDKPDCCPTGESPKLESSCSSGCNSSTQKTNSIPSFGSSKDLADKAELKVGDVVVDFGSGPGSDLLRAAEIIGPKGKAIGIDMTPEMIEYSTNLAKERNLENVEVKLGDIENVPLDDNIADVIISNCVINLTSDKKKVFKEVFRILKPGGRLVDADMIADQVLPLLIKNDKDAWCGCIAGALTKEGYREAIEAAGFIDIKIDIEQTGKMNIKGNDLIIHSGILSAVKPK